MENKLVSKLLCEQILLVYQSLLAHVCFDDIQNIFIVFTYIFMMNVH